MNDTDGDELWNELREIDRRYHARLEDRFGRCVACHLTATRVLLFGTITWSVCDPCRLRWPADADLIVDRATIHDELTALGFPLETRAAIDDDMAELAGNELSQLQQLPPIDKGRDQ